jgi:hypothetical protein
MILLGAGANALRTFLAAGGTKIVFSRQSNTALGAERI